MLKRLNTVWIVNVYLAKKLKSNLLVVIVKVNNLNKNKTNKIKLININSTR